MDNSDPVILGALGALKQFSPKSVFLYGSRGRGDFKPDSDYELGVVFDDNSYIDRSSIHSVVSHAKVKAYPFKWGELSSGSLDFLFQKSLYLREITTGAKTVAGEDLIPQIATLPITTLDLVQDIRFSIARALDALVSYRSGDMPTSMDLLTKSCFYGLRDLAILELKTFPLGYKQIYKLSHNIVTGAENLSVIDAVHILRDTDKQPSTEIIYNNISLLDSFIEPKLVNALKERGDIPLI